mmetsp:Transcript_93527/g.183354  ORF Transcript_93527/g.183354 Transcript_93527/m.183354 type:complete len:89 (-) Transcript_93527:113-379(-)
MFFSKEERASVLAENPGMPPTEVSKALGARWKEFTADQKAPYEALARADKERFNKEMAEYKKKKVAADADAADADEGSDEAGSANEQD